jgi:hypothetical protein
MFKKFLLAALSAVFLVGSAHANTLTQLHEWESGDEIQSTWLNGDIQQLITESNAQDVRLNTIESGYTSNILQVLKGGTGASTASGARTNLGAAASGANSDITSLSGLTTPLSVSQGGIGLSSVSANRFIYTSALNTFAVGTFGSTMTLSSGTLDVTNNTSTQKHIVSKAGTTIGTRQQVNLVEGTGITLTVADNPGDDRVDVTVAATATGAGLTLISTQTASSSATIDFTGIDGTYDNYLIIGDSIRPATDASALFMRVQDGGSWQADASDYKYSMINYFHTGTPAAHGSTGAAQISMSVSGSDSFDTDVASHDGEIMVHIYKPAGTTYKKRFKTECVWQRSDGIFFVNSGWAMYDAATAVTGIRFLFSAGNIATGTFRLYGYKNSP